MDLVKNDKIPEIKLNASKWVNKNLKLDLQYIIKNKKLPKINSYFVKENFSNIETLGSVKFDNKNYILKQFSDSNGENRTVRNCTVYDKNKLDFYLYCQNIIKDIFMSPYNELNQGILFGNLYVDIYHNPSVDEAEIVAGLTTESSKRFRCMYMKSSSDKSCNVISWNDKEKKWDWLIYGDNLDDLETEMPELDERKKRDVFRSLEMSDFASIMASDIEKIKKVKVSKIIDDENKKKKFLDNNNKDNEIVPVGSGTGFFVNNNGHIVTNFHVIEGCRETNIQYLGKTYSSNTLAIDRTNDLAILSSKIKPKQFYKIASKDVELLEEIFVAGYPLGKYVSSSIKVTSGRVSSLAGFGDNFSNFQIDAALNHGNSGGPIINQYGNVVGVAVSTLDKKEVESFNFGIKSSTLNIFAKSNNFNFDQPNLRKLETSELGKLITNSTVYLECLMTIAELNNLIENDTNKALFVKEQE